MTVCVESVLMCHADFAHYLNPCMDDRSASPSVLNYLCADIKTKYCGVTSVCECLCVGVYTSMEKSKCVSCCKSSLWFFFECLCVNRINLAHA